MAEERGTERARAFENLKCVVEKYSNAVNEIEAETLDRSAWLNIAGELGRISAELRESLSKVNRTFGIKSGRDAILYYLQMHVGESVPADALAGVSGITEWARRVRELRVEFGWPIESGITRDDMPHDHYRLTTSEPDVDLAERWRVAKEARNLKKPGGGSASGKDRLLHYLQQISPRSADKEQLAYVARIHEWPRRLRELEEEGWRITSNVDDPSLAPGSYRLPTMTKHPARVRQAIKLRYRILERDKKSCRDCGAKPGQGVTLQVHHILPVHKGGTNDEINLVTLCSDCHGGRHALMGGSPKDELLNPDQEFDLSNEESRDR